MKEIPAFPTENIVYKGMTLRDYFAAKALLTCNVIDIDSDSELPKQLAVWSYRVADAMMKARGA